MICWWTQDLGDNYPRGIHLHRFPLTNAQGRESIKHRVVYGFKTKHGTSARSPAGKTYDEYTEISGGGNTFYKWSNDNNVYANTLQFDCVCLRVAAEGPCGCSGAVHAAPLSLCRPGRPSR